MRTFVVSLPGSPRREATPHLGLPFEFSDGVLLPLERVEFLQAWMREHFPDLTSTDDYAARNMLSQGSLGTLLAFVHLFQRIAEQDDPFCLVLEDDCVANPAFEFAHVDWDDLHATYGRPMFLFLHKCSYRFGLVAQLVTREGARFVLDRVYQLLNMSIPIDLYIWQHPEITRASVYFETHHTAWLFEHVTPVEHAATSERIRINRAYGHAGDLIRK